jgi:O-antigen ligase
MKENASLMILIIFMLVSILWSNMPYISFKRWTRELVAVLMAFVVLSEPSPRKAVESILRRIIYILIPFSVLLIKYFPIYGVGYGRWSGGLMWVGVTLQKNSLAVLCLIAAFFLIWTLVRRMQGHNPPVWKYQTHAEIFVLFITLWLVGGPGRSLSYSATANTALGVGLLVYLGFHLLKKFGKNLRVGGLMIILVSIIIFGIVAVFTSGHNIGFYVTSVGRDASLTGRTQVWASLLPIAMQRPLTGHGFGGFWTTSAREFFEIPNAHSGYLDELLSLGFVGILLVSIFLLASCRKAHRELSHNFDWGILWICFLIMAVVHNITESSIYTLADPLTAIILFLSVSSTKIFSSIQQV